MVTFLAGGTGTPKLLAGVDREDVTVVGNTGDDVFLGGHLVCPDLDTVLFMEGDVLDRETWWGIEGDTEETHGALHELADDAGLSGGPRYLPPQQQTEGRRLARWRRFSGVAEFMQIGDRDRAVHITRTGLLDEGHTLTEVTRILAEAFDCVLDLLPMSDDPVASIVETPGGEMHFQAFWVGHEGEPDVEGVQFRGAAEAEPTDAVREALEDPVVIGPSNPVTSIGPMAAIDEIREALPATPVAAVSPFVDDKIFSGPAAKLMASVGQEPSTRGVAEAYPYVDAFVLDSADRTDLDRPTVRTDTEITDREDAERVWRACELALDRVRGVV